MSILKQIENHFGEKIVSQGHSGGGCIAQSQVITMESGASYFLKTRASNKRMFPTEANSLKELAKANSIRIPKVILTDSEFLLIENIQTGKPSTKFFEDFGRQFAEMHRYTADAFGFFEDNFIGHTPQENIPDKKQAESWASFYFEKRLMFQFKLAEKQGLSSESLRDGFRKLENAIDTIIPQSSDKPTLLHGDLWSGNYLADEKGNPVIIDPAVYYGHREADLAMTKLFGGFSTDFYNSYSETFPLEDGYHYRENIYILYHVLNHLNLFGMSYHGQAVSLLRSYF